MSDSGRTRIAYLTDAERIGGAEKYLELLALNIDRDEFEPLLVTCGSKGLEPMRSIMREAGVPVVDVRYSSPFAPIQSINFMRTIGRYAPAILHMNLPGPFDANYSQAAPLARLAGVKAVVTTEHLPMVASFPRARVLRKAASRYIDRVITVSEDNRRHLVEKHGVDPSIIVTVLNGIPDPAADGGETCKDRRGGGGIRLLTAGSLEERKGHRMLMEAMKKVPAEYILDIAGTGPLEEELRSMAADPGLSGRVRLLGHRSDMRALMAGSDIFVLPSMLEATPYVIIEAMASGRPVIASRIFGIPELVEDDRTGLLVEPGDPERLAGAIARLGSDRSRIERMGGEGRKRFESLFTLERFIERTTSVYRDLPRL